MVSTVPAASLMMATCGFSGSAAVAALPTSQPHRHLVQRRLSRCSDAHAADSLI